MSSLYVGNLHPECTIATLYKKFSSVGPIFNIHICRKQDTDESLGYGYVNFAERTDAEKALTTLNYDLVLGRAMRVMWSVKKESLQSKESANLFVKNLDSNIDEKTLYDLFSVYGDIVSLKVATNECGESKGYGFVQFDNEESATNATEDMHEKLLRGRQVFVGKYVPRKNKNKKTHFQNIYLKNFERSLFGDEDLRDLCSAYGTILSAKVMLDENGVSKGFGFVSFKDSESAKKAVEGLNGTVLEGKRLFVGRAKKKAERQAEVVAELMKKLRVDAPEGMFECE